MMDWEGLLPRTRLGADTRSDRELVTRTHFQRDFDRIVFSSAFRRMQDKTQVFPLAHNDYVRTRLTHSLEVASVGRTLGTRVGETVLQRLRRPPRGVTSADFGAIVAAACLAHDIGNPPFGHSGEDGIRHWFHSSELARSVLSEMHEEERQDFLNFEGNAQGFRVLCRLQQPDNSGGMQLTHATLGTFAKYPRASFAAERPAQAPGLRKHGYCRQDSDLFRVVARSCGLLAVDGESAAWCRHPLAWLLEAADDVCYGVVDLEDGFRLGCLSFDEVRDLLRPLIVSSRDVDRQLAGLNGTKEKVEYLRARAIGSLIDQVCECFLDHETQILSGRHNIELVNLIAATDGIRCLKQVALERLYFSQQVIEIATAGYEVLGRLLETFVGAVSDASGGYQTARNRMLLSLVPSQFIGPGRIPNPAAYPRVLGITDFVSGMTDSYAVSFYKKLTGMSLPGS